MEFNWYEFFRGLGVGGFITSILYIIHYYRKQNHQAVKFMIVYAGVCLAIAIIFWKG